MNKQTEDVLALPLSKVVAGAAKKFTDAFGYTTVGELLRHFPRRYLDPSESTPLTELREGDHATVMLQIVRQETKRTRSPKAPYVVEVWGSDGKDQIRLAFFPRHANQVGYYERLLKPGSRALFDGTVTSFRQQLQISHPRLLELPDDVDEAMLPLYPATAKLTTLVIMRSIGTVLDFVGAEPLADPIPKTARLERGMRSLADSFRMIHRPGTRADVAVALRRFQFEEALVLQTELVRRKRSAAAVKAVPRVSREDGLLAAFDASLPFTLTDGQRQVGSELAADLATDVAMNRLLQGDVGSGKTLVALRAMLTTVDAGGQAALLAPTEVLATQHARSIQAMLGPLADRGRLSFDDGPTAASGASTRVALLTGSLNTAARREALSDIASGTAGIVIGTHALLSERVSFADLGLVVVDEQHRFGVEQRDALRAKAAQPPHLLVMTATPIPRTVAMTVFGDLDVSTLRELPAGRQPVQTAVARVDNPKWIDRIWQRAREEVDAGRQVFVVCARIGEPGEKPDEEEFDERLDDARRPLLGVIQVLELMGQRPELQGIRLGMAHGGQPAEERDRVMREFASGELPILVATTVIEVGVNVPNATMMVIFDADRFGLSQLHQLRGRIGRGSHAGLCILVDGSPEGLTADMNATNHRLIRLADTSDGFDVAELDLETRAEGDVLGAAQSGKRSSLRTLRAIRDADLIGEARDLAEEILTEDPELRRHPELKALIDKWVVREESQFLDRS